VTTPQLTNEERENLERYIKESDVTRDSAGNVAFLSKEKKVNAAMEKQAKMKNLGSAAASGTAMATMMTMGMVTSKYVDQEDSGEKTLGTIATMAPMIGMMFGPWGSLIGTGVGLISGLLTLGTTEAEKR
jgi:biopolymer transport protein ExbB/TolQ